MTTGDRIRNRRIELGLSVDDLSMRLGKNRATVYRYESNDIVNLPASVLRTLCRALETTPEYLMGWTKDSYDYGTDPEERMRRIPAELREEWIAAGVSYQEIWRRFQNLQEKWRNESGGQCPAARQLRRIPVLRRITAGDPLYTEQHIAGYTIANFKGGAEYFGLIVKGDSMSAAGINNGYTVIVRRQNKVENGEIAVCIVGDEDATIRRFYASDNVVALLPQSTNPIHTPKIYDTTKTPITVLGKAVKVEFML